MGSYFMPTKANYANPVTIIINKYLFLKLQDSFKNLSKEFLIVLDNQCNICSLQTVLYVQRIL